MNRKYGIKQFIIVDVEDDPSEASLRRAFGSAAASYLESTLTGKELVGISSWSRFINSMVEAMHPKIAKCQGVIQILGGAGHNRNLQANILTDNLARLLECPVHFLPSTSWVQTPSEKARRLADPEIADVVALFPEVDIAIVGVGTSEQSDLRRNLGIVYREEIVEQLSSQGAVGDICLHYYDAKGKPLVKDADDPVISMTLEQLRACPRALALAGGLEKVGALKGAMAGGYIDVLVTDRLTALELMG